MMTDKPPRPTIIFHADRFDPNSEKMRENMRQITAQCDALDQRAAPPTAEHMAVRATRLPEPL